MGQAPIAILHPHVRGRQRKDLGRGEKPSRPADVSPGRYTAKLKVVDSLVSEVLTWAMIGSALGHYRIEAKLGEGGMGVVYRAFDTHLDRPVAIKILRADATTSPERRRRFQQEAKAASALNHPNIVHIYDIGSSGGMDYIAMEFVGGQGASAGRSSGSRAATRSSSPTTRGAANTPRRRWRSTRMAGSWRCGSTASPISAPISRAAPAGCRRSSTCILPGTVYRIPAIALQVARRSPTPRRSA